MSTYVQPVIRASLPVTDDDEDIVVRTQGVVLLRRSWETG